MVDMTNRSAVLAAMIVALAAGTGGCEDYLDRRDTVTLGVGDAVAHNKATQTINRWPRAAYEDRWVSDGERARLAIRRYRTDTVKDPEALGVEAAKAEPDQTGEPIAPGKDK